MPVWRTVATSCRATLLARAQVNPLVPCLHALFANSLLRLFDVSDPINVNAYLSCHSASIQFADDSQRACESPTPNSTVDRTLSAVLQNYQQRGSLESRQRKTIACQCFGK